MPGGRLVEDEHARSQPQEAEELELLPLAHGERPDVGLEVDGEPERTGQLGDGLGRLRPPGDEPPGAPMSRLSTTRMGGKSRGSWCSMPTPCRMASAGERMAHGLAVEHDLPAVRRLEAGQDLHERALAGPVLAEDALDGAGGHGEGDAVVGFDRAEMLADVSDLYFHPNSGPVPRCCARIEPERGDRDGLPFPGSLSSATRQALLGYALAFHALAGAGAGTRSAGRWPPRRPSGRRCRPAGSAGPSRGSDHRRGPR